MYSQQLAKVARQQGFKRTGQHVQDGAVFARYYEKVIGERKVEIQFFTEGSSRVLSRHHGCSDTLPTDFNTEAEMLKAIEHESTRTDSKYCSK